MNSDTVPLPNNSADIHLLGRTDHMAGRSTRNKCRNRPAQAWRRHDDLIDRKQFAHQRRKASDLEEAEDRNIKRQKAEPHPIQEEVYPSKGCSNFYIKDPDQVKKTSETAGVDLTYIDLTYMMKEPVTEWDLEADPDYIDYVVNDSQ